MNNRILLLPAVLGVSSVLLTGCLFRPTNVPTRSFVLSPLPAPADRSAAVGQPAIGVGVVRVPSYLQRSALALRGGGGEVHYLEAAQWAERLDQSFQGVLAANLAVLLPTDQVRLSAWKRDDVRVGVQVTLERFDVDAEGRGTLVAWWRLEVPGREKQGRRGESRLTRAGAAPAGDPRLVVETLNGLAEDFSRGIAQALREVLASADAQ